jgi:lipopolysaccharide/colanic/teichoic acid biosynthesis glycosyltransferase
MAAFPHVPSLPRPIAATLPFTGAQKRVAPATVRQPGVLPRPIREVLFRDAFARERARADRFGEPFVVARLTRKAHTVATAQWDRVTTALSAAAVPGDLVGWFKRGTMMGVIRPAAASPSGACNGAAAADALRRDLERCLAASVVDCSVHIDVYDPAQPLLPEWPLAELSRQRTAPHIAQAAVTRAIDVAGSLIMLVLLAPLMAAAAVLVKATSPGPVFFRQERVGARGQLFRMIKFRTIRADADATIHQQYVESFIEAGEHKPDGDEAVCKLVNDPRLTPVGRFLRRWSIDEVPQFWNVLVGEMSLVGPRPALPYEVARYKTWHLRRVLEAKPGMTGLWQVNGRSRTSFDEMVRLDLRYTRTRTIRNDLKLLLATPRAVLSGKGAH